MIAFFLHLLKPIQPPISEIIRDERVRSKQQEMIAAQQDVSLLCYDIVEKLREQEKSFSLTRKCG